MPMQKKKKPAPRKRTSAAAARKRSPQPESAPAAAPAQPSHINKVAPKLTYRIAGTPVLPLRPKS
jgi:hypothetical protein